MFVIFFLQAWKIIGTLEKMGLLLQLLKCGYKAKFWRIAIYWYLISDVYVLSRGVCTNLMTRK